jgi:alpha-methylacyl-CoA racemase
LIASKTASQRELIFRGVDACVVVVKSLREAVEHPHFIERGLFKRKVESSGMSTPALPTPIVDAFRAPSDNRASYPDLSAEGRGMKKSSA